MDVVWKNFSRGVADVVEDKQVVVDEKQTGDQKSSWGGE